MNIDRINEVYAGQLNSPETQQYAKMRIDWICENVAGRYVLDIGCSQGITSILLARQEFEVTGIDINEKTIEYAKNELQSEPADVRNRVNFFVADVLTESFGSKKFDTVVIGELIEHLKEPEKLLEITKKLLRKNGRIIVTVPFGFHPHDDHKITFYPDSFQDLMQKFFATKYIDINKKYILYIGCEKDTKVRAEIIDRIKIEELALKREKELHEKNDKLKFRVKLLEVKRDEFLKKNESLQFKVTELSNSLDTIKEKLSLEIESKQTANDQIALVTGELESEREKRKLLISELERNYNEQFKSLKSEIQEISNSEEKLLIENSKLLSEIKFVKNELKSERDSNKSLIAGLEMTFKAEVDSLKSMLKDNIESKEKLTALNSELRTELDLLKTELNVVEEKYAHELLNLARSLEIEKRYASQTKNESEELIRSIDALQKENKTLKQKNKTFKRDREKLIAKNLQEQEKIKNNFYKSWKWRIGSLLLEPPAIFYRFLKSPVKSIRTFEQQIKEYYFSVFPAAEKRHVQIEKPSAELWQKDSAELNFSNLNMAPVSIGNFKIENVGNAIKINSSLSENDYCYINCMGSQSLNKPSGDVNYYSLAGNTTFLISLNGEINCDIDLWILFYDDKKRHGHFFYKLDCGTNISENFFTTPRDCRSFRLAFKVIGKGEARIEKINIIPFHKSRYSTDPVEIAEFIPEKTNPNKLPLKIACILDEFSYNCFKHDAEVHQLTLNNYEEEINRCNPDLLMVESAWNGEKKLWRNEIANINASKSKLTNLIAYCKGKNIPTVFWNKEDPPNFEVFIEAAKLFDYIFTTDAGCIEKYKELCGHAKVFALPFAAQPAIHNPLKKNKLPYGDICFAGSWYRHKYQDREHELEFLLDAAQNYDLHIFDRNFMKNNYNYRFPQKYWNYIKGSLNYSQMLDAYRNYKIFLNTNSVNDSPTMFARRVFEILACCSPVVSNYSKGIQEMFNDLVNLSNDLNDSKRNIQNLLMDEKNAELKSHLAYRLIHSKHTYKERLKYIHSKITNTDLQNKETGITIIIWVRDQAELDLAVSLYENQTYKFKELVVFINPTQDTLNIPNRSDLKLIDLRQADSEQILRYCSGEFISILSLNNTYGPNFLEDLVIAAGFTNCYIIGKSIDGTKKLETSRQTTTVNDSFSFSAQLLPYSAIIKRECFINNYETFVKNDWGLINNIFSNDNYNTLSADEFNYLHNFPYAKYLIESVQQPEKFDSIII